MANYDSIESIINAGTSNMQAIRNNNGNDDGIDNIAGVSWFNFNDVVANTIYVCGNTWLGFGVSTEQLKVNRRDAKVYYIYREEGTLYNYYRFLKIRWRGYSVYTQTGNNYLLEYDVILWETGDISLYMVNIPATNNDGAYSLTEGAVYNYTVSAAQPHVTFYKDGSSRRVANELIVLQPPYNKRFLIRSNSALYDTEGAPLQGATVAASTFETYGGEEPPAEATLLSFVNPELLLWHDSEEKKPKIEVVEIAKPPRQILYSGDYDLTDDTILGIEDADIVASEDVLFAISFDMGVTWKAYNGALWYTLTSIDSGMSATTFESVGVEEWAAVVGSAAQFRVRAVLPELTSYIESVIINFLN